MELYKVEVKKYVEYIGEDYIESIPDGQYKTFQRNSYVLLEYFRNPSRIRQTQFMPDNTH